MSEIHLIKHEEWSSYEYCYETLVAPFTDREKAEKLFESLIDDTWELKPVKPAFPDRLKALKVTSRDKKGDALYGFTLTLETFKVDQITDEFQMRLDEQEKGNHG